MLVSASMIGWAGCILLSREKRNTENWWRIVAGVSEGGEGGGTEGGGGEEGEKGEKGEKKGREGGGEGGGKGGGKGGGRRGRMMEEWWKKGRRGRRGVGRGKR